MAGMALTFVLVHAPALGPASWQPVAAELAGTGCAVAVPSLGRCADGPRPYWPRLVSEVTGSVPAVAVTPGSGETAAPAADRLVLVLHSGAGPFAGQLCAALAPREVMVIFADASLPGRDGGGPVVDAAFLPSLRELARDGLVPPWPQWFPGEDLAPLFPDAAARSAVLAQARALPLGCYTERIPAAAAGWPPCRAAYLLFSAGYQQTAAAAAARGWPVAELAGEHLHMLVRPAEVAMAIIRLAEQ